MSSALVMPTPRSRMDSTPFSLSTLILISRLASSPDPSTDSSVRERNRILSSESLPLEMSSRRKMSLLEYSELMMMSIRRETSAWNSDTSAPDLKDFSLCPVKAGLEEWRRTARSVSREDLGSLLLRRLLCRSRARGSGEAGAIFEGRTFETGERYSLVGIGRILRVDGCDGGKKGIGQSGFAVRAGSIGPAQTSEARNGDGCATNDRGLTHQERRRRPRAKARK